MDESRLIYEFINKNPGDFKKFTKMMIDVGALYGSCFRPFIPKGWNIHAFEPHQVRYKQLLAKYKNNSNVVINPYAISNKIKEKEFFYVSDISPGISSLIDFHNSHKLAGFQVKVLTLKSYMKSKKINNVTFLKIDTEGNDLPVLKGYPWDSAHHPEIILCEYENLKTDKKLGYRFENICNYLTAKGYHLYVSEWYPIVRYGGNHKWKEIKKYPCKVDYNSWGNIIAIKSTKLYNKFNPKI